MFKSATTNLLFCLVEEGAGRGGVEKKINKKINVYHHLKFENLKYRIKNVIFVSSDKI